ncbi:neutral zinc metallopeptidase [Amaricoccus sp.]|uniref:neutral zinc metallopeptidase n=1 Tax=Amaricoccus sp. TaxID=1872485 RepID=UPI001B7892AE|nr:neutral zinc metallopeptidase [Amaricoccus sp.]MBP7241426.1 neutral zinc metallopeptidase [Amaricoccus sp.]
MAETRTPRLLGLGFRLLALTAASVGFAAVWSGRAEPEAGPLSSERAGVAAALSEAAAAEAGTVLRERIRVERNLEVAPTQLRLFSRAAPNPCTGGAATAGAFYCAEVRMLAIDLATLDGIRARMRRDGEAAVALFAGRAAAAPAQEALGTDAGTAREQAAAGDCLAGVWAARSGLRGVSPEVYGRTLVAAAEAVQAASRGAAVDAALFAPGAEGARKAAFARGLAAGTIASCAS